MQNYRIALVEALSDHTHVYSRTYLPRVGLATIAAVLKQKGYTCDLWIKPMTAAEKKELANYDLVGIGSLSSTIDAAYALADDLRKNGSKVVMGGPHVTFRPEEALNHCDFVVKGEGEETFLALVKELEAGESPNGLKGISYKGIRGQFTDFSIINGDAVPGFDPDFNKWGCCSRISDFGTEKRTRALNYRIEVKRSAAKAWFTNLSEELFFGSD